MKSTKKYFDMPFGGFCGVLADEVAMKKIAKLLYKQNQELKELLMSNTDHLQLSSWTLAHPNGKQESIHYVDSNPYQTIEQRINLIDKTLRINKVDVYFGTREEAIAEHMRLYDSNIEVEMK